MRVSRRRFVRNGAAAFTMGLAAPSFLNDVARAQGSSSRNLVVLYLGGGNDALSFLVPYADSAYYARRPTLAVPSDAVLPIGSDSEGTPLGLHPNLPGVRSMFDDGRVAIVQRTGYQNASRSHFLGSDIWATANPGEPQGPGWLGRYLETLPSPVDPLIAWNTVGQLPHSLEASSVGVPSIPDPAAYDFATPNGGADARHSKSAAVAMASRRAAANPHLAFINSTAHAAHLTLDRVAGVAEYEPTVSYPETGFGLALQAVAGAMVAEVGTKTFWVQTGGYDTHSGQRTMSGLYADLLMTLNDGLFAFYADVANHGLLNDTLLLQYSEFGRRIDENGSQGTDHGGAGLMMAIGGGVRGGLYGTAGSLVNAPDNPVVENGGIDVAHETDFRSVYARVIDEWLDVSSVDVLGDDFSNPAVNFI